MRADDVHFIDGEQPHYAAPLPAIGHSLERDLAHDRLFEFAELRSDPNGEVMRLLHNHLTRLGWRTVTSEDREKAEERALDQRVAILHEIRALEARQAQSQSFAAPTVPLDDDRRIQFAEAERADVLAKLSPDRREAYFRMALWRRIQDLASGGKISEPERQDLEARLREASQRYG